MTYTHTCVKCGRPWSSLFPARDAYVCGECSAAQPESAHPEYRSEPAELLGREGMVTVWDDEGRYVGCMGVELWKALLTTSAGEITA